jgi:hypothetical protein
VSGPRRESLRARIEGAITESGWTIERNTVMEVQTPGESSTALDALLDQEAGSLATTGSAAEPFRRLHAKYADELGPLSERLAARRQAIVEGGWSADFSDREGELLYITIREARPELVVEISPCHGYSTNYILAALRANGSGVVHSYELTPEVDGVPTENVIRGNLLDDLPGDALRVIIGDARSQEIPAAGVLLVDSAHEDHFAAWVFETLIPHAGYVVHHDLVVAAKDHYEPKGWRVGPRESSFVLEALRRSGRAFFSAAAGARHLQGHDQHLVPRFPVTERAILYRGHQPSAATQALCAQTLAVHQVRRRALEGVRPSRLDAPFSDDDFLAQCIHATMLADLGYTGAELRGMLGPFRPRPRHKLSSGELVYYFHYLHHAGFWAEIARAELAGPRCTNPGFARTLKRTRLRDALGR